MSPRERTLKPQLLGENKWGANTALGLCADTHACWGRITRTRQIQLSLLSSPYSDLPTWKEKWVGLRAIMVPTDLVTLEMSQGSPFKKQLPGCVVS